MKFSIPFKLRRIAAILGAILGAIMMVVGLTAPAAQAAGSAGDGFTVSTEAGVTPGTSTVTVRRTLLIPDVPIAPTTPQLTLQLGGGATFSPAVATSVTFSLSGNADTIAYTGTIKCGTGTPTLTVVGYPNMIVPVLCSGATPPPDTSDLDGDGVLGDADKCPNVAAPGTIDGCPRVVIVPPADADGDGVLGDADKCPDVAGTVANNGCPEANQNEQVCVPLSSGKKDTTGDPLTVTITAPEGMVITGYCVKAGSANQGEGPEYPVLTPDQLNQNSLTIAHSSGKAISHYSFSWGPAPTTPVTPPAEEEPPAGNEPPGGRAACKRSTSGGQRVTGGQPARGERRTVREQRAASGSQGARRTEASS